MTTFINDGGPAFPATEEHGCNSGCSGITLRDYFAAQALNGICASGPTDDCTSLAREACHLADAMIAARNAS